MKGDEDDAQAAERHALRKSVSALGWKWIGRHDVAVRLERELHVGPRTIVVRGRVEVPLPAQIEAAAGEAAAASKIATQLESLRAWAETAAAELAEPDDQVVRYVFEQPAFVDALDTARRGLLQAYQALTDRRLDERVEAELGLPFYLGALQWEPRTFCYYVGPTNSGKTHAAIEALRAAESGVYLAPLRLLALEVYERLNDLGTAASLVTGEERVLHPYARHVSSTVEMIDARTPVDIAVIDEAQQLEDPQRGWAWTQAIAGARAKHVILCGSDEGLRAARRLAAHLGVTLDVRQFRRKNPLRVVPAVRLGALEPGDAVVAFSRKAVIELQSEITARGRSSAAIYGALSPVVRRREAERFRSGAADVLVATDAIGLGLNLPIRRVIFSAVEKWDGTLMRALTTPEIRQLAGRAGRYGLHEEGLVSALHDKDVRVVAASLERSPAADDERPIWIAPTDEHLRRLATLIGTNRVGRLLRFFATRVLQAADTDLRIADLTDQIDVAAILETSATFMQLPLEVRCLYSRAPVNSRGPNVYALMRWGEAHAAGSLVRAAQIAGARGSRDELLGFEDRSRLATLYLWLSQRFPQTYCDHESVVLVRESIDRDIARALLERGTKPKKAKRKAPPYRRPGPPKRSYGR